MALPETRQDTLFPLQPLVEVETIVATGQEPQQDGPAVTEITEQQRRDFDWTLKHLNDSFFYRDKAEGHEASIAAAPNRQASESAIRKKEESERVANSSRIRAMLQYAAYEGTEVEQRSIFRGNKREFEIVVKDDDLGRHLTLEFNARFNQLHDEHLAHYRDPRNPEPQPGIVRVNETATETDTDTASLLIHADKNLTLDPATLKATEDLTLALMLFSMRNSLNFDGVRGRIRASEPPKLSPEKVGEITEDIKKNLSYKDYLEVIPYKQVVAMLGKAIDSAAQHVDLLRQASLLPDAITATNRASFNQQLRHSLGGRNHRYERSEDINTLRKIIEASRAKNAAEHAGGMIAGRELTL